MKFLDSLGVTTLVTRLKTYFALKSDVPSKTSDLTNDSGFLTTAVTSFNGNTGAVTYTAPVTSVNGATGAVTIPSLPSVTSSDNNKVLMVVNGAWAAASLPTYNGEVS